MSKVNDLVAIATSNIASEMGAQRIKAKEISKLTGLSASTISHVYNDISGHSNPQIETLLSIWVIALKKEATDLFK
ncbi:hypothetical protein DOK76_12705 [Vagococcus sp. DIV0080]|uniref:HTH cro/C1-type domain-containing protein n=1 Tax=Candidatus Vagococcus giribetii TaxID=2230876 RepID=A0ABS3HW67_9ENTE|nr:hypothetical protein [Vagococcus sp. DIV0080]MBO0477926.1 hypothetical protein [Vagococcus sp. DIV0080]